MYWIVFAHFHAVLVALANNSVVFIPDMATIQ
jgi:hypothetical protein